MNRAVSYVRRYPRWRGVEADNGADPSHPDSLDDERASVNPEARFAVGSVACYAAAARRAASVLVPVGLAGRSGTAPR